VNKPYRSAWNFWRKNWHWLMWVILFGSLTIYMGIYEQLGSKTDEAIHGALNFLTSPCLSILIAIPIAVAILGAIMRAIKK